MRCIAVDMGAGSVRVMLGRMTADEISYQEIHRIPNNILRIDGRETWDLEALFQGIRKGIGQVLEESREIPSSIGIDSWGVDYVFLDAYGEMADTAVSYRDRRTEGMLDRWRSYMSDEETFRRTGINYYVFNTLYQLLSARESRAFQSANKILFVPAYISFLLCGEARNEISIASTSQLLHVESGQWDRQILKGLRLEASKLGKLIEPGKKLGRVLIPEARYTGMECVSVSAHDTACVVASIPVENPNFAYISAGTWCIVGLETRKPLLDEKARLLGITNERGYGQTYRPLKNIVGLWLMQGLRKQLSQELSYAQMEEMIAKEEEIDQVIDPDDPLFYNPGFMKEAFDLYFDRTGQPRPGEFSNYLRCAYDSLCFSFLYYIEQLEELADRPVEVIHMLGGGSQSEYLCQRAATICRRELLAGPVEGATLGNILIQGIAMGEIPHLSEGRKMIRNSFPLKLYQPQALSGGIKARYHTYLSLKNI